MNEVERLKCQIEQLETVIGVDRSATGKLRQALGLEPDQASILGMLLKRDFVTRDGLCTVMYAGRPECDWPDEKVLDVQFCRLRATLKKWDVAIQTARGEGWFMSKPDKKRLQERIESASAPDLEVIARREEQRRKRQAFLWD